MSTQPCPNCGAQLPQQGRFCGQCGTTISPAADAPLLSPPSAAPEPLYKPDVHEEVTVARELPDLSAYLESERGRAQADGRGALNKTLMDQSPFGAADAPSPGQHIATPVVPSTGPDGTPQAAGAVVGSRTQMLGQTLADPAAEARARERRDAAFGSAATAQAPPAAAKVNLNKTMMMGGDQPQVPLPAPAAAAAPTRSDPPSAPQRDSSAGRGDASPLSRSVLAPQSWLPPGQANNAADGAAAPGVDVSRVVPVGGPSGPGAPAAGAARTMLGMLASNLMPPAGAPGQPPPSQAAPQGAAPPLNVQKTMMGVAIPGIAPLHGGGGAPAPSEGMPPNSANLASKQSTMLGVAIPGIAPTHSQAQGNDPYAGGAPQGAPGGAPYGGYGGAPQGQRMPSQVQNTALGVMAPPELAIVPRPQTLINEPLPEAPILPQKRGIPAVAVVGILFALVAVVGGIGAFFALRGGGTLTAVPQLDENGRESLKIGCTSCPDGTTVALGASSASVAAGAAVLPLPAPLSIGENDLSVKIDRPGAGRDEDVKIHVPVAYRVRADLSTLSAKPPAITVRIEATPGSEVKVEDKPVTLDATGRGAYSIDLSKDTEGTGEAKTFERKIPFAITPKGGKPESGQLTARTAILPLALDAPGRELFTDKATAAIAGQTRPNSTITIDGQNVAVDATGRFGVRVELSSVGEKALEIVAAAPPQAPRIAKVRVVRVASLADAAKEQETHSPIAFDAFGADPASKVGQRAVVEGDVVEARTAAGHTVLLIDNKRGCAKGASCLVRIVHGDEDKLAHGDFVRVYGTLLGSVTASGKTMPDIEAALVLPLKAGK